VVRRYLESAVDSRTLVWIYSALLVTVALAVVGLSVFLILFLAPRPLQGNLGAVCAHGAYCPHKLPLWGQFGLWLSAVGLLGWLIGAMGWTGMVAFRAGRKTKRAVLAAGIPVEEAAAHPVREVADSRVFAFTLGTWRPIILVSSRLRQSLSPDEFAVVLAHEEAHARARDNLVLLVARLIEKALFFFPGVACSHEGVRRHVEVAADAVASKGTGDRLLVASSVNHVARLLLDPPGARVLAPQTVAARFGHGELVIERVQRLVDDKQPSASRRRLALSLAMFVLVLALFSSSLWAVTGDHLVAGPGAAACLQESPR
jgi:Zn-dependent protease with chaperone function